ncbi:BREX-1 system adenine-specific DNA-methyltransferase PglX [Enterococcus faecalis]|uniref:BREX-1 system adenine-specific DNA-methyltransferase PglX n=1 Tax=Enterococcus faecalis TaxID=1351 RepID=UPI003A987F39
MRHLVSSFALQEIKLLDNAMGSGHVLVYAFDVFMQLYVAEGFRERDAAESILINNLFGLEIDKRSYQLAYFAIMMKGREYSRRILTKNVKLHLHQFIDSDDIPNEYFERLEEISSLPSDEFIEKSNLLKLVLDMFLHATELGSVLNIQNISQSEIDELRQLTGAFEDFSNMDILYQLPEAHEKVNHILNIVEVLSFRYTAVVTNPPYLNKMSSILSKYVKDNYPEVKTDLFSVFIKMNSQMLTDGGYAGFMTPFVWMFIKSYEELRDFLIANKNISSLVQMEYSAFEEATVPVCCFTIKNAKSEPIGNYFKLSDFRGGMNVQKEKVLEGIRNPDVNYLFQTNQNNFTKIPGSPISFWVSENIFHLYDENSFVSSIGYPVKGIDTGNNDYFLKYWFEINKNKTSFMGSQHKWFPYNKGGEFRRWYGNREYLINYESNGYELKKFNKSNLRNKNKYFLSSLSWSTVTSSKLSVRANGSGFLFDNGGSSYFSDEVHLIKVLALLNSKVAENLLRLSPTLNFQPGDIGKVIYLKEIDNINTIDTFAQNNINLVRDNWDSNEFSWDFKHHPLI